VPLIPAPYTLDFGSKELINMVGLPAADGNLVLRKLLENPKIKVIDNKVSMMDVSEVVKQTEYYRKMQKIERARRESASRM